MKNLKKALSMVLASAMLFSMMVVGTGAAHADVTAEHNEEAIAVVSAAGIMGANEEFNPDNLITRNEMAVVMVNMLGLDTDDYAGASQFTDVPAWAADYVDACYANGIVSGVSATEFNGGANVTTAEAALMVMKALGYFQYASDFGADWLLATVKQASKIDLLAGIDAKAKAAMTRNEVAQLVLNALEATMVEADEDGIGLDANGNLVSKYEYVKVYSSEAYADDIVAGETVNNKYTLELGEDLFEGDLVFEAGVATDGFGRPAVEWTYDGKTVGTFVTKTPAFTFNTAMDEDEIFAAIGAAGIQGEYDKYIVMDQIWINGKNETAGSAAETAVIAKNAEWNAAGFGNGVTVEIYKTNTANHFIMVSYNEFIGTVGSVIKADAKKGIDRAVTVTGIAGSVETEDFKAGDVVLYTVDKNGLASVKAPETISGKVTKITSAGVYTVGGENVKLSQDNKAPAINVGDKGTWYVDSCGNIIDDKSVATTEWNYGYLVKYQSQNKASGDLLGEGSKTNEEKFQIITAEGKKVTFDGAFTTNSDNEVTAFVYGGTSTTAATSKTELVRYTLDKDGKIDEIQVVSSSIGATNVSNVVAEKGKAALVAGKYVNDKTVFFAVESASKFAVYTGYKNIPSTITATAGAQYIYAIDADGNVKTDVIAAVVLPVASANAQTDDMFVWFASTANTVEETEDGTVTTYTNVYLDGVKGEISFKGNHRAPEAGVLYTYTVDTKTGYATLMSGGNYGRFDTTSEILRIENGYYVSEHSSCPVIYTGAETEYFQVDEDTKAVTKVEGLPAVNTEAYAIEQILAYNTDPAFTADTPATIVYFTVIAK